MAETAKQTEGDGPAEDDVLYHYCPFDTFLRIVQTRTLWLTDLFSTNDTSEHRVLRKIAAEAIKEELTQPSRGYSEATLGFLRAVKVDSDDTGLIYLACFSREHDDLGQWCAYGDVGQGVTIGFSRAYMLARREEVGLQVLNVEYHRDAQRELVWPAIAAAERAATQALGKVDEEARFRIFRTRLIVTIWGQALKCKDPRFAQEREVRVVWEPPCEREEDYGLKMGYRASRGKLTRFYELPIGVAKDQQPIKAVTLGPKNAFELDDVRKVVAESGYNIACVTFSKSGLPYR